MHVTLVASAGDLLLLVLLVVLPLLMMVLLLLELRLLLPWLLLWLGTLLAPLLDGGGPSRLAGTRQRQVEHFLVAVLSCSSRWSCHEVMSRQWCCCGRRHSAGAAQPGCHCCTRLLLSQLTLPQIPPLLCPLCSRRGAQHPQSLIQQRQGRQGC